MKVYYFTIIAVGLMITLMLAGVDTNSSKLLSSLLVKNVTSINPDLPSTATSNDINFSNWWIAIATFIVAAGLVTSSKISIGVYTFNPTLDSVLSVFVGGLYGLFVVDMVFVISFVGGLTNFSGWMFWVCNATIISVLAGYTIALVEFIQGRD